MSSAADPDVTRTLVPGDARGARLRAGERVAGRYAILGALGRGGMAEVYEALDEELHERVALKVLARGSVERFRREVQLARRVTHPGACRIFDLGVADGMWFCTMELIAGDTLAARRARGLAPRDAQRIARAIAEALAAAHAAGVVHGDLKPSNVLLAGARVVVSDFGLARALDEPVAPGVGSPAYMAPEQLRGDSVGPAADVYALGLVMLELVAGARALSRAPAAWRPVIARCLEEDPARRFTSAGAVCAALARRGRGAWLALGGAAIAGAIALALALPAAASAPALSTVVESTIARIAQSADDPGSRDPVAQEAFARGTAALRGLHFAAARVAFREAIAAGPSSIRARLGLAEAAWALGAEAEARGAAQEALDLAEHAPAPLRLEAEAHHWETSGRPQQAAALYAELVAGAPDDIEARFQLARAQWHAADSIGTRATLRALRARAPGDLRLAIAELREASGTGRWARVLELAPALLSADAPIAFEARMAAGAASWALGALSGARTEIRAALALAEASGDANGAAGARYSLGLIALDVGELGAARAMFAAIPVDAPDARGTFANREDGLARTAIAAGQLVEAGRALAAAREAARQSEGHQFHAARMARTGAQLALARGQLVEAQQLGRESAAAFHRQGWLGDEALALGVVADAAAEAADRGAARAAIEAARAIWQQRGAPVERARCELRLARLELAAGDARAARAKAEVARAAFVAELPDDAALADAVLASALVALGDRDGAAAAAARARPRAERTERPDVRARVLAVRGGARALAADASDAADARRGAR